jgi:hypothetical protein
VVSVVDLLPDSRHFRHDGSVTENTVLLVGADDLARWLPRTRALIDQLAAYSGGRFRPEDVVYELAGGAQKLWLILDWMGVPIGAVSVMLGLYPSGIRACLIRGTAGRAWQEHIPTIRQWAVSMGHGLLELWSVTEWPAPESVADAPAVPEACDTAPEDKPRFNPAFATHAQFREFCCPAAAISH